MSTQDTFEVQLRNSTFLIGFKYCSGSPIGGIFLEVGFIEGLCSFAAISQLMNKFIARVANARAIRRVSHGILILRDFCLRSSEWATVGVESVEGFIWMNFFRCVQLGPF